MDEFRALFSNFFDLIFKEDGSHHPIPKLDDLSVRIKTDDEEDLFFIEPTLQKLIVEDMSQPINKIDLAEKTRVGVKQTGCFEFMKFFKNFQSMKKRNNVVLIVGKPGIGKSTILKIMHNRIYQSGRISFLLDFLIIPEEKIASHDSLIEYLYSLFGRILNLNSIDDFTHWLQTNRAALLLDGFDEIVLRRNLSATEIDTIIRNLVITSQIYNFQIVFTARTTLWASRDSIKRILLNDAIYEVQDWSIEKIKRWIKENKDCYSYNLKHKAEDIYNNLEKVQISEELLRTPFILKSAVQIYPKIIEECQKHKKIYPAQLYRAIVDFSFEQNDRKLIRSGFKVNSGFLRKVFQYLALNSVIGESRIFIEDLDFKQIPHLEKYEIRAIVKEASFHREYYTNLIRNFSFLKLNQKFGLNFIHETIAEYLCAEFFINEHQKKSLNNQSSSESSILKPEYISDRILSFIFDFLELSDYYTSRIDVKDLPNQISQELYEKMARYIARGQIHFYSIESLRRLNQTIIHFSENEYLTYDKFFVHLENIYQNIMTSNESINKNSLIDVLKELVESLMKNDVVLNENTKKLLRILLELFSYESYPEFYEYLNENFAIINELSDIEALYYTIQSDDVQKIKHLEKRVAKILEKHQSFNLWFVYGNIQALSENYEKAIEYYEEALNNHDVRTVMASRLYHNYIVALLVSDKKAAAFEFYKNLPTDVKSNHFVKQLYDQMVQEMNLK